MRTVPGKCLWPHVLLDSARGGTSIKALSKAACTPTILVLLLSLCSSLSLAGSNSGTLASHGPIFIDGNADFTANDGVTGGFGTAFDPYRIEGWDINASLRVGLVIQNTDAYVRIRNVSVHDGGLREIGIRLYNVKNVVLESLRSVRNREGIEASAVDGGLTIISSYFEGNGNGILLWRTTGIIVRSNTFVGDGVAFIGNASAHYSSHDIVGNLVNGRPLLYYTHCSDVLIDAMTVGQVVVADCSRVTISRLLVSDTDVGIVLAFVDDAVLRQNTLTGRRGVSGTDVGISAQFVRNVTIESNVISDIDYGISFDGNSSPVVLRHNEFTGNTRGVFGWLSDFRIEDNLLMGNWRGLDLVFPSMGRVSRNTAIDNEYGIHLGWANDVVVAENQASSNGQGVSLLLTANVTVVHNNLTTSRGYGILDTESENVTVAGNDIRDNWYGVYLSGSRRSRVYHNNFVRNENQAGDRGKGNGWDAGYPGGGNYWSNHSGADRCSGAKQDICSGSDGIGDLPVPIVNGSQDRYPLMEPRSVLVGGSSLVALNAPSILASGEVGFVDVFAVSPQGVDRVLMHHRENTLDVFRTLELAYLGGSHYQWIVTAPGWGGGGVIEYYVEVRDRSGNVTVFPANGTLRIQVQDPVSGNLPLIVSGVVGTAGAAAVAVCVVRGRRRTKSSVDDQVREKP